MHAFKPRTNLNIHCECECEWLQTQHQNPRKKKNNPHLITSGFAGIEASLLKSNGQDSAQNVQFTPREIMSFREKPWPLSWRARS